jgi:hypothetical protein
MLLATATTSAAAYSDAASYSMHAAARYSTDAIASQLLLLLPLLSVFSCRRLQRKVVVPKGEDVLICLLSERVVSTVSGSAVRLPSCFRW